MGGFKNQREVFTWEGETLEVDETKYEHGTLYEIECETVSYAKGGWGARDVVMLDC
jgi:hypothetical protein